jgi:hypothetical protein
MRHAVMAAALAFHAPLTLARGPLPGAARRIAGVVMGWLDRRRRLIDEQ